MVAAKRVTERLGNRHVEAAASQQEKQAQYRHVEEQHQRENKALPACHSPKWSAVRLAG